MQYANSQLNALAHGYGRGDDDFLAKDHSLARLTNVKRQRFVEQMTVLHDGVQRIA
ncbi:hypothetical protein D3C71_2193480 [compost metagenome]